MIPLLLRIRGFLSYRDQVELDFTAIDLACISGRNGAGKSALLDAITWSLFGQARKRDDSLINSQSNQAEVSLIFSYEGNEYRIQRAQPRGKSSLLEFQVRGAKPTSISVQAGTTTGWNEDGWKPLTERTTRETQARIEDILRLDFETFVNSSFLLQGKADQFTQQTAGKRKDVLSSILGLEIWESYRERAQEKRKSLESSVDEIDGRLAEIDGELEEEQLRKNRLNELEATLERWITARSAQESIFENLKKSASSLAELRKLAMAIGESLASSQSSLANLSTRLESRQMDQRNYLALIQRTDEIQSAYKGWQQLRSELEKYEGIAQQFHEQEASRIPLLEQIASEKARLVEEQRRLLLDQQEFEQNEKLLGEVDKGLAGYEISIRTADTKIEEHKKIESKKNKLREELAGHNSENEQLKARMEELKSRIDRLNATTGVDCPLCGQPLSPRHRKSTLKKLSAEGKINGDQFRENRKKIKLLVGRIEECDQRLEEFLPAEQERLKLSKTISQMVERKQQILSKVGAWQDHGLRRLVKLDEMLAGDNYAKDARKALAEIDKALRKLGYNRSAHERIRQEEIQIREVEEQFARLQTVQEVSRQNEKELENLTSEIEIHKKQIAKHTAEYQSVNSSLENAKSIEADLNIAEKELLSMREKENQIRDECGAARQKVEILATLRIRKNEYALRRNLLAAQIASLKNLEHTFGKDGVPALLIEQALPEIESRANELLDRLSDGQMSVRFVTQAEYKDKKREDLRETLDIQISDSSGVRDYEMFSGGEAFRVNFAIRLALSELLARRKGARLQTLVIDEGFGSQDLQGRQRLIEAINLVKPDFAKILVITHLDELKDSFPSRIEVEKTEHGSTLLVV